MSIRCPLCKHRILVYRVRRNFVCEHCQNPLVAQLLAPRLVFLLLFIVTNGFITLVWWTLVGAGTAMTTSQIVDLYPPFLIILDAILFLGLFVVVFSTLTYVCLDREKLPTGWPNHGDGNRHYRREELAVK